MFFPACAGICSSVWMGELMPTQWQRNMIGIGQGCSRIVMAVQRVGLNLDLSSNPIQYSVVNSPACHLKDRLSDFFMKKNNLPELPTSCHNFAITFNDVHMGN